MKAISGMINGAFTSFSSTVSTCCGWSDKKRHHGELHHAAQDAPRPDGDLTSVASEKSFFVLHDQPTLIPPPSLESLGMARDYPSSPMREQAPRKRHGSKQSLFSMRRGRFSTSSSSRRPQISAPSNFRHVYSGSTQFLGLEDNIQGRPRRRSFRPLELSIYRSHNQLSPILPSFTHGYPSPPSTPPVTPPQRAITHSSSSEYTRSISHERSVSSLSFHIPRRPANTGSVFDSPRSDVIRRPSPARLRAYTSPEHPTPAMNELIERVATAMLERDRLQEQIEDVIERQSIYVSSRPSTANGVRPETAYSMADMEPMPEVPALPPNAPSFSERLSIDRPQTAPVNGPTLTARETRPFGPAPRVYAASPSGRRTEARTPPPPLPLRLRPPLRKKKSFSHVSSWLGFPADQHHNRGISGDSVTNQPLPVQAKEGFYQVAMQSRAAGRRSSSDSDETVSDWTSDAEGEEEEEEETVQTVPTSWSPSSSATIRAVDPARSVVYGQAPQRQSVGVAF